MQRTIMASMKDRKTAKAAAKQDIKQGERLAKQRDTKKKQVSEMSATEQQILKDYETNKLSEKLQTNTIAPDRPFRGTLLGTSSSSATEQATNFTEEVENSPSEEVE